eukprot:1463363-Karenia_brevis.AAC.1
MFDCFLDALNLDLFDGRVTSWGRVASWALLGQGMAKLDAKYEQVEPISGKLEVSWNRSQDRNKPKNMYHNFLCVWGGFGM